MSLFTMTISLFLIMDSVGNSIDFLNVMRIIPKERQRWIILREMLIALAIMIVFQYFGELLLDALEVSPSTVRIAGGLVLFLIAIKMVFPSQQRLYVPIDASEPFIVPIATPMVAGPTILATIMFYAYNDTTPYTVVWAILIAWVLTVLVFGLIFALKERISTKVLVALEKLMGLILTLMSVEMFLKGLRIFIFNLKGAP